jgi:hypothetical protein
MSDENNTNMYIGLAVVAFIVYYYMFMMTPAPITCDTGYILKDGKCVLVQVTSVAPATGTADAAAAKAAAAAAAAAAARAAATDAAAAATAAAAARAAATDAAARAAATDAAAATAAAAARAAAAANIISSNSYVLQNAKNGGCLTHSNNGAGRGPIEDWSGSPFCDPNSSQFSTQAKWKLIEHPTIKGSYVLQNANNGGCLTHSNNGAGQGPIEDWPGSRFCDPNSSEFSTQALWKLIEHPTIKGSYVLKNDYNGGCLTHSNNGAGHGPIEDWQGSSFCDPNSSQFATQALWKFTKT